MKALSLARFLGWSGLIVAIAIVFHLMRGPSSPPSRAAASDERDLVSELLPHPLAIAKRTEEGYALDWLRSLEFPADDPITPSHCLHLMRLGGREAELTRLGDSSLIHAWDTLTKSSEAQRFMGHQALVRTRHGWRFPTQSGSFLNHAGKEAHRDQCLAAMGKLGIDLDEELEVTDTHVAIREVLRDSVANFHLRQEELSWTTIAYALYLSPTTSSWTNRFAQHFTFDALVTEILSRPLGEESCGGTHRFFALTLVQRADDAYSILSPDHRQRLDEHQSKAVALALSTQREDGTWPLTWHAPLMTASERESLLPIEENDDSNVLMTGHVAEWLLSLPASRDPNDERERVTRLAADWLESQIEEASSERIWRNFCPFTHAVCVVDQVQRRERGGRRQRLNPRLKE